MPRSYRTETVSLAAFAAAILRDDDHERRVGSGHGTHRCLHHDLQNRRAEGRECVFGGIFLLYGGYTPDERASTIVRFIARWAGRDEKS